MPSDAMQMKVTPARKGFAAYMPGFPAYLFNA
jgi:hypothetical protein